MKLKRLLSVIGLGLFAAVSAGAGVALNSKAKAEPVKADGDTWMTSVTMQATSTIINYEGFEWDSMYFHTYTDGVGNDKWFQMYPIKTGNSLFQVNATFPEDYTFNRVQFKFSQSGVEKWGKPSSYSFGDKEHHYLNVYCNFYGWEGDEWTFTVGSYNGFYASYNGVNYAFEEDPANARFIAKNVISDGSDYLNVLYRCSWDFVYDLLTDSSKEYIPGDSHGTSWVALDVGTYDFVIKNNNSDNGVLQIYKHESASSYVYIVNESSDCFIYTFGAGGQEQFGEFPGTKIDTLVGAGEAEYVGGSLSFQNSTTTIYRVNVEIGYPVADHLILAYKNEYGYVGSQSADMLLVAGSAYWFSNDTDYHNDDAGIALDSLCNLRTAIYSATGKSVCNMTKSAAEALVNEYNSLTSVQRETYFDCSELETLKRDGSAGSEYVNCKLIMEEVAKIAEIDLVGSPRTIVSENGGASISSTTLIAVISVIALVSVSSIVVLVVIKKRKHN